MIVFYSRWYPQEYRHAPSKAASHRYVGCQSQV